MKGGQFMTANPLMCPPEYYENLITLTDKGKEFELN